jgi:hypothetical protein
VEALERRDTPSTTALTVSPNPATAGQALTLTATVTESGTDSLQPGTGESPGSVTFFDGSASLGTVQVRPKSGTADQGVAQISAVGLGVGTHSLSARFSGSSDTTLIPFRGTVASTSNPVSAVINPGSPPPPQIVAVAFRRKGVSRVRITDAATGAARGVLTPFRGFGGRLALQLLDVNGDGSLDLVVRAVVNGRRKEKAFDARTLAPLAACLP